VWLSLYPLASSWSDLQTGVHCRPDWLSQGFRSMSVPAAIDSERAGGSGERHLTAHYVGHQVPPEVPQNPKFIYYIFLSVFRYP